MSARLTRLKINRFRDTKPTELHFSAGFNVLLGLNGTGKTTLLDLIAAICSDDLSPYAKEAFDVEYEVADAAHVEPLCVRVWWDPVVEDARRVPSGFRVLISPREADLWVNGSAHRSVRSTEGEAALASGPDEAGFLFGLLAMSRPGLDERRQRWLDVIGGKAQLISLRVDEGLLSFHQLTNGRVGPMSMMLRPEWMGLIRDGRAYGVWNGMHVPWLEEASRVMGFADVEFSISRAVNNGIPIPKNFSFKDPNRGWVDSERLSYGQKRLFTFHCRLAALKHWSTALGPFIADELSNGLHHAWIQHCMEKLEGMQSFLSAQGPLVLDKLPWGSAAELQKMFVRCERQGASILWRNLTEEEALELHQSGEQGYEKTSETLKRQGLW